MAQNIACDKIREFACLLRRAFYFVLRHLLSPLIRNLNIPVKDGLVIGLKIGKEPVNSLPTYQHLAKEHRSEVSVFWMCRKNNDRVLSESEQTISLDSIKGYYILTRANVVFTDDKQSVESYQFNKNTTWIRLFHEFPVKYGKKSQEDNPRKTSLPLFDYQITTSDFCSEMLLEYKRAHKNGSGLNISKFISLGFPVNDRLLDENMGGNGVQNSEYEDKSVILYAPTSHKKSGFGYTDLFPFDDFDVEELNDLLVTYDSVLLIRFHPGEENDILSSTEARFIQSLLELDRVELASHSKYNEINNLLPLVDVLITDYSGVYHQFLLLDRPIIFVPLNYEKFKREVGFKYDYYENLPGPSVETFDEFKNHLILNLTGEDTHKSEREKLCNRIHKYNDSKSTQRVSDFIIDSSKSKTK